MDRTITVAQLLFGILALVNIVGAAFAWRCVTSLGWRSWKRLVAAALWPLALLLLFVASIFGAVQ